MVVDLMVWQTLREKGLEVVNDYPLNGMIIDQVNVSNHTAYTILLHSKDVASWVQCRNNSPWDIEIEIRTTLYRRKRKVTPYRTDTDNWKTKDIAQILQTINRDQIFLIKNPGTTKWETTKDIVGVKYQQQYQRKVTVTWKKVGETAEPEPPFEEQARESCGMTILTILIGLVSIMGYVVLYP